ncbi:hypothetical protein ABQX22_00495 [Xanthomonas sp. WHRI 1810A]|uniref:hypothetical protein n=1 Tax=Xanthomonas sp. WHRI 1810A TaxID=3161565 RepID=UPI0032E8D9EC
MGVLKQIDPQELATRKELAEWSFRATQKGYDAFAATDEKTGRTIGKLVDGGIEAVLCVTAFDIAPTLLAKVSEGYTMNPLLGTKGLGLSSFELYMNRPEKDIQEALVEIFAKVEQDYQSEIDAYNDEIIQKEIDAQVRLEIQKEQRKETEAANKRRDRIAAEVKTALGAAK